tara:strand:- start:88 stop:633 length:546 start_codon:yes stop_codon:yes gene_type:complete
MGLESATYISQLVNTYPAGVDNKNEGDNHLRLIKAVLQAQFPNLGAAAITATAAEINELSSITATPTELNKLDGCTASTAELNITDGLTATTGELNKMDGVTATTGEINFIDGVTSNIQTQLNGKAATNGSTGASFSIASAGTSTSKAIRRTEYATSTLGGTIKMRVSGGNLYIRNDGSNA